MSSSLQHDQIDVWLLPIDGWDYNAVTESGITELLSAEEQLRLQRFRPVMKKVEFIASRLLLRHLLRTYTEWNIKEIEAIADDMGRPFWFLEGKPIALFFSLSHTKNMICCSVSRHKEIGCDIELLQPRKYQQELATRVFSEKEQQFYHKLPQQAQSEFFYRSWTLKEAFVKALGQGLRIPLTSLSFTHKAERGGTFTVPPNHLGDNWTNVPYCFHSSLPTPCYSLGIATPLQAPRINMVSAQLKGKTIEVEAIQSG